MTRDDTAIITSLAAAGLSDALIAQTRATCGLWRDVLAETDPHDQGSSAGQDTLDQNTLDEVFRRALTETPPSS